MEPQREERRLTTILSADVAGYSRLMGEDEAGTLRALKTHRDELIDPKVAEHKGRIVKLMGDGALVEFPSVVEAVRCAVEIQRGMAGRRFLDTWAAQASALGWSTAEVFGCHRWAPVERYDAAGLVMKLNGDRVVAMTADDAVIENSRGARARHYRQLTAPEGEQAILWEMT